MPQGMVEMPHGADGFSPLSYLIKRAAGNQPTEKYCKVTLALHQYRTGSWTVSSPIRTGSAARRGSKLP